MPGGSCRAVAVGGVDLFRHQVDVVPLTGGELEDLLRPLDAPGKRVALGEPERAEQERAFATRKAIVGSLVATDETTRVGESVPR